MKAWCSDAANLFMLGAYVSHSTTKNSFEEKRVCHGGAGI
jgi:hypothetical protein